MNKPLALFDIDKTIFDGWSYFVLVKAHIAEGLLKQSVLTRAEETIDRYERHELDYELMVKELLTIYAHGLQGKSAVLVRRSTQAVFASTTDFFAYAAPTIAHLKQTHEIVFVTGSAQFTAEAVGRAFGVSHFLSTEPEPPSLHPSGASRTFFALELS